MTAAGSPEIATFLPAGDAGVPPAPPAPGTGPRQAPHPGAGPITGWGPTSPCGDDCVPPVPAHPDPLLAALGTIWAALRVVRRVVALLLVMLLAAVTALALPLLGPRGRAAWLRAAAGAVLRAAGVRPAVRGDRRFGDGVLVVANHQSWIEILALAAVQPVRLVAKSEIAAWPVIGPMAAASGAVFVARGHLRSLPGTVEEIAATLRAGHTVAVFPEGTTWCGAAGGVFRRALFQAAVDARVPVRPVGVVVRERGVASRQAAFVGDQGLLDAVVRVLRCSRMECELTVQPLLSPNAGRAELALRAGAAVTAATGVEHPARRSGADRAPGLSAAA